MSSNLAYAAPSVLPHRAPPPRHIEIVATRAQRRARPRLAYAVVTVLSLFVIFAGQLLLSIVVSQGAYQISSLQTQQKELLRTQGYLTERLRVLDSTQNLATQAAHLGMAPNASPLALDLTSGAVFALPGSADPVGCGGACNLITNSLLTGVTLVTTTPPAATPLTASALHPPAPLVSDALPAPVTH